MRRTLLAAVVLLLVSATAAGAECAPKPKRSALLTPAEVGLVALHLADVYTTTAALRRPGTYEANPAMAVLSGRAMLATKVGVSAFAMFGFERLHGGHCDEHPRDPHPKLAVALAIGANVGYAFIVAHNARVGR